MKASGNKFFPNLDKLINDLFDTKTVKNWSPTIGATREFMEINDLLTKEESIIAEQRVSKNSEDFASKLKSELA